ncbi:MAG: DNA polymerase III subunit delta [Bacteroidales bacterium]|jgi:DNA polymerase-3 subunit delta|nr:DNA polymerase III subunit delta [Bacteroidales bacterium]
MEYKELMASLADKKYVSVYLLTGEEPYFIDKVSNYIEDHFFEDEALKDFNFQLLYGKDVTANQIVAFAKEYPMMSDYRLIIVREAQNLDNIAYLTDYVKNPQKQTVLVLCYKNKKLDGKTTLYKTISKLGIVFNSAKIYEDQLPEHIKNIVKEKGFQIGFSALNSLATHIGTDLSRIDNEIEKLINIVPKNAEITLPVIEKYVGISKEYNIFELVKAVISRNPSNTYKILNYFSTNPVGYAKTLTVPALYTAFYQLLQYHFSVDKTDNYLKAVGVFWKDLSVYRDAASFYTVHKIIKIMHLLRKYDLMTKGGTGVNIEEQELMKELIFQIFYA